MCVCDLGDWGDQDVVGWGRCSTRSDCSLRVKPRKSLSVSLSVATSQPSAILSFIHSDVLRGPRGVPLCVCVHGHIQATVQSHQLCVNWSHVQLILSVTWPTAASHWTRGWGKKALPNGGSGVLVAEAKWAQPGYPKDLTGRNSWKKQARVTLEIVEDKRKGGGEGWPYQRDDVPTAKWLSKSNCQLHPILCLNDNPFFFFFLEGRCLSNMSNTVIVNFCIRVNAEWMNREWTTPNGLDLLGLIEFGLGK